MKSQCVIPSRSEGSGGGPTSAAHRTIAFFHEGKAPAQIPRSTLGMTLSAAREILCRPFDPRVFQITSLTLLLGYGLFFLHFDVTLGRVVTIVTSALAVQWACGRLWRLPRFDPKSALISALSLCLLLRTGSTLLALMAVAITIASKFVIRVRGKHVFNPTNFGIVSMMALTHAVWISPGQWGNTAFFGFLMLCAGGLVVNRAARSDVTYAFLAFYVSMVLARFVWLGDPLAIPIHRLESGALLLFAFFMISDPKTTPDSRPGRIAFAFVVSAISYYIQFKMFRSDALLWALVLASPLVPLFDLLFRGTHYSWSEKTRALIPFTTSQGESHAKVPLAPLSLPGHTIGTGA
ncbi:MAG TPA: RnfABCDGE type electron transport complex subunit D [Thermoanaerobaculia bacterium]|nr:RnfABCDGE type electron transport complex subunit D [Thermoanaerobaculia bacterium]